MMESVEFKSKVVGVYSMELLVNWTRGLVRSLLFCIQYFSCLANLLCMLGVIVEIRM